MLDNLFKLLVKFANKWQLLLTKFFGAFVSFCPHRPHRPISVWLSVRLPLGHPSLTRSREIKKTNDMSMSL